jgi:phage tail-like protein
MSKPFSVNVSRFDPYKTYRFLVYFDTSTTPVAGVSKVTGLKRSTDPIEVKEGGNPIILQGLGRTKYEPVTLERGITHDTEFEDWADRSMAAGRTTGPTDFRKDVVIELFDEAGALLRRYTVFGSWVAEYQALPDLDANANAVAVERIKLEHEGWERDDSVPPP